MSEFCFLAEGMVLPRVVVEFCLDVERRGIRLSLDGEDVLVEGRDVTDDDMQQLRRWKPHVRMLIHYCNHPIDRAAHLYDTPPALTATTRRAS